MPISRFRSMAAAWALGIVAFLPAAQASDVVRASGTGMGLGFMHRVQAAMNTAEPSIDLQVLPSLGTPGGLRALADGAIEIAMTGRALTTEERAAGIVERACLVTPLVFVTSRAKPEDLSLARLPEVISATAPVWPDGSALRAILRVRSGTENTYLAASVPGVAEAFTAAYLMPGVLITRTDQDNADLAQHTVGSLAYMTLLQLASENLELRALSIDGVTPSAQTLEDGRYPLALRMCLATLSQPSRATRDVIGFVNSSAGHALMRELGAAPVR
jgi:phosphate transport system substrate-binding protein